MSLRIPSRVDCNASRLLVGCAGVERVASSSVQAGLAVDSSVDLEDIDYSFDNLDRKSVV